jgi:hypothetical protein
MYFVRKWSIIFQGVSSKSLVRACSTECFTSDDFVLLGYEPTSLELLKMKMYIRSCRRDSNAL